ncbi:MAG: metallophosphoesterase [Clostridiales bacterium]
MALTLLIIGIFIYCGFIWYLWGYWERAFKYRFPHCRYIIRPVIIFAALFPFVSTINFIWHPNFFFMEPLVTIGFIVACFYLYLAMFMVITHLFVLIFYHIFKKAHWTRNSKGRMAMIAAEIVFSLFFCFFGLWNATHTEVNTFSVGTGETTMNVVALVDIHYGTPGSIVDLEKMVNLINSQNPDLVLIAGDVLDNDTAKMSNDSFKTIMAKIEAPLYVINGNHEYYQNTHQKIANFYQGSNINLLVDEATTIDGKLRIAGRDDYSWKLITKTRTPLNSILKDTDKSLPLIVLDHQPQDYREAKAQGAVLQLSGHTHNGQLWPGNILIHFINKIAYNAPSNGIYTYGNLTLAITRGYGTWGFPMRTTGPSEIYNIELKESLWQK